MKKTAKIIKRNGGYYVLSEKGDKKLGGPYATKGEAVKRLQEVEYWKHIKGNDIIAQRVARWANEQAPGGLSVPSSDGIPVPSTGPTYDVPSRRRKYLDQIQDLVKPPKGTKQQMGDLVSRRRKEIKSLIAAKELIGIAKSICAQQRIIAKVLDDGTVELWSLVDADFRDADDFSRDLRRAVDKIDDVADEISMDVRENDEISNEYRWKDIKVTASSPAQKGEVAAYLTMSPRVRGGVLLVEEMRKIVKKYGVLK